MTVFDQAEHDLNWDQIPLLLNGTLSPEDVRAMNDHIAICPKCAEEVVSQRLLIDIVAMPEMTTPNQADALVQITGRLTSQTQHSGPFEGLRLFVRRSKIPPMSGLMLGGAIAASVLIGIFALAPPSNQFETVTSTLATTADFEIRVRYASDTDPDAIRQLLETAGATDVRGPSETGLLRANVARDTGDAVVENLMADPRILFVAKDD